MGNAFVTGVLAKTQRVNSRFRPSATLLPLHHRLVELQAVQLVPLHLQMVTGGAPSISKLRFGCYNIAQVPYLRVYQEEGCYMSSRGKITLIACLGAAIAIVIGAVLWHRHPHTGGLFIGFAVGIGCTVVAYAASEWVFPQRKTEVPPPKQ